MARVLKLVPLDSEDEGLFVYIALHIEDLVGALRHMSDSRQVVIVVVDFDGISALDRLWHVIQ